MSPGRVALTIGGVLLGVLLVVALGAFAESKPAQITSSTVASSRSVLSPQAAAPSAPPRPVPKGQQARDGKFGFTIISIESSKQAGDLSNQFEVETAQGVYLIVTMMVQNISDQPQSYFGANQRLIDSSGREYSSDNAAEMWANKAIQTDINPGNSVAIKAIFDVPPDIRMSTLELHDSAFSGGVMASLG
jgi:ABC-type antimicrobial peptide transport system permease subunit